ncbi:hypothetical protein NBRC116589_42850 [Ruegeria sp. HU-ET01832]
MHRERALPTKSLLRFATNSSSAFARKPDPSTPIPEDFREELASAKRHAKDTYSNCVLEFGSVFLNVTSKGARDFSITMKTSHILSPNFSREF